MRRYFGTDGVRGLVGKFPITVDFALKLGNAVGQIISECPKSNKLVIIGQDTRSSSDFIKYALVSGLNASGVDVIDLGIVPTPVVAFITKEKKASVGFVITASHNKFTDNGIKLFSSKGFKLSDDIEINIEKKIDEPLFYKLNGNYGKYFKQEYLINNYIESYKEEFASKIDFNGKIIIDCANGAGYLAFEKLLSEFNLNVIPLATNPNGLNINHKCGATYMSYLSEQVKINNAQIGIALDGDGDRIMLVDEDGNTVDGDAILYILSQNISDKNIGVVGTAMTNMAYENKYKELNIPFVRAKVGDKYVMEELVKNNYKIGGESSGHIINLNYSTTGDGLLTALQLLAIFSKNKEKNVSEYQADIQLMSQCMINVPLNNKVKKEDIDLLSSDIFEVEERLKNNGRVLLRPSGTEPVLRVMVEAKEEKIAKLEAEYLVKKVKEKLI